MKTLMWESDDVSQIHLGASGPDGIFRSMEIWNYLEDVLYSIQ